MAAAAPQRLEGLGLLVWVSGLNVLEPFVVAVQGHKDFRRSWAVSRCADSLPGQTRRLHRQFPYSKASVQKPQAL